MADKKITKAMNFDTLLNVVENSNETEQTKADLKAFIEHEKELLARKASTGDTKKIAEHNEVKEKILDVLLDSGKAMTCTEITKAVNAENGTEYTSNKVSAMLKKLVEDDKTVTKAMDKKVAYFSAV